MSGEYVLQTSLDERGRAAESSAVRRVLFGDITNEISFLVQTFNELWKCAILEVRNFSDLANVYTNCCIQELFWYIYFIVYTMFRRAYF